MNLQSGDTLDLIHWCKSPAGFESALRIGDRVLRGDASRRRPSSQKLLTQFLVIGADDFLRLVTLWRFPVAEKFGDYSKRCVRNSARVCEALNCRLVGQLRTTTDSVNHKHNIVARFHRFEDGKRQTDLCPKRPED